MQAAASEVLRGLTCKYTDGCSPRELLRHALECVTLQQKRIMLGVAARC